VSEQGEFVEFDAAAAPRQAGGQGNLPRREPNGAFAPRPRSMRAPEAAAEAGPRTAAAREAFARADAAVAAAQAAAAAQEAASAPGNAPGNASGAPAPPPKLQMTPEVLKPSKIQRGDYVIHKAFGIGRFEGLYKKREITIQWDEDGNEFEFQAKFLRVKFKDGDLELRLPDREQIKLFKRKAEEEMEGIPVNLDSMRSRRSWEKRKAKATAGVFAVAADLLKMYAERQGVTRPRCAPDDAAYHQFAAGFQFEPTADQLTCFEAIRRDMVESDRPMDRLICGDVGFGKTEVGMRAIYRAVANGRQVAFLAPTTVLAAQHLRVLRKRMPEVRVELLSGLVKRTAKQLDEIRADITAGHVQVAVGTHALLSDKITFANLGLLVVDEEQRFGVKQKEKIKGASANVDVLSLTATPIPRTFYMCATGIRDMSLLATPPSGRLKVQTKVATRDDGLMLEYVQNELARGGQVFYVVPRIDQVAAEVEQLESLLPGARISFAYSGLRDLEARIVDFTMGNVDVMVATTIMENGIDIPNVNTLVVQNSHLFGLAQMHQLRGRVGRSNLQAYALLLHPPRNVLSEAALKRMQALEKSQELGVAGYQIAQSDLNLRGAGNVFGTAQKGVSAVGQIGLDMYLETLQRAMKYLQETDALEGSPEQQAELEAKLIADMNMDESTLIGLSDSLKG